MKLVGEAFKENSLSIDPSLKVPVLAISNWCSVANYETLIRPNVSLKYSLCSAICIEFIKRSLKESISVSAKNLKFKI